MVQSPPRHIPSVSLDLCPPGVIRLYLFFSSSVGDPPSYGTFLRPSRDHSRPSLLLCGQPTDSVPSPFEGTSPDPRRRRVGTGWESNVSVSEVRESKVRSHVLLDRWTTGETQRGQESGGLWGNEGRRHRVYLLLL